MRDLRLAEAVDGGSVLLQNAAKQLPGLFL
jgi:hypothetical protein